MPVRNRRPSGVVCGLIRTRPSREIRQHLVGGARGNRTPDLLNAIQALSQLSYGPIAGSGGGI